VIKRLLEAKDRLEEEKRLPAVDLKSQINGLVKLQSIDSEIYALRAEKDTKPLEAKALETSFEEKKQHLAELEKKSLDLQKKRKDAELELGSKEEATKKLQTQLYSLKTNKEYQVMLQQIQDAKADSSVIEDKILELFEQADKIKTETEKEKQRLKEEEKVFNEQKKKIEERIKEIDDRLAQLEVQRKQALPEIDPKILSQYERILFNRDGLAIVSVKDNSCAGCNMFVPPQVINLIKMYERIVTCEICNRILYINEES
jgi:predicted  nucleic acid-binding Zn-ribbon protein